MFSISYINNVASTAHAGSVFLLSYSSKIFNQRVGKFSLGCFLCKTDISTGFVCVLKTLEFQESDFKALKVLEFRFRSLKVLDFLLNEMEKYLLLRL